MSKTIQRGVSPMDVCPICKKEMTETRCRRCGYDESLNYERYATLMPGVADEKRPSVSVTRRKWTELERESLRCRRCGKGFFWVIPKRRVYVCTACGEENPFPKEVKPDLIHKKDEKKPLPKDGKESTGKIKIGPADPLSSYFKWPASSKTHPKQVAPAVSAGYGHAIAICRDGKVLSAGPNYYHKCEVRDWRDVVAVAAGPNFSFGVKKDGTILTTNPPAAASFLGNVPGLDGRTKWVGITAADAASGHMVAMTRDGKAVLFGDHGHGRFNVTPWRDVVSVSVGEAITLGLNRDGKALVTGVKPGDDRFREVAGWKDLAGLSAGGQHAVGLKRNGTVIAAGDNLSGQCDVEHWSQIKAVAAGDRHTVGLKDDGTVVAVGRNAEGQCNVTTWTDIVAIAAGGTFTIGIRADGTAVSTSRRIDVSGWSEVRVP
ncbi:MAG: hypothetical protein LUH16_06900 [Clostridiales bacterium]|nr:hypothetical protein [Clostridiales bacterium]